jgi:hypothetical protein
MTLLEVGNCTKNIKGFENSVRAIRMKWDAINNKTVGCLPEKLWGYFYAKIVMGYKNQLFPEILKAREEEKKRREEYRRREQEEFNSYFNPFAFFDTSGSMGGDKSFFSFTFDDMFMSFMASLFKTQIPEESFIKLGLTSSATVDQVKESYRILALKYHPDKGGNNDLFISITEAKNKCLMYLKNKTL